MATRSAIEWTEMTWNPVTGCTKVSPGCANCYAERMARRLKAMGAARYAHGFELTTHADALDAPSHWKAPRKVFVNSMSDLFHKDVPLAFIQRVFEVMHACPQHQFQILTKRSRRALELATVPAAVRFLSVEPLLGPIPALPLNGIHWVIVGGESGPHARPMQPQWVEDILGQCRAQGVPFFFKQWGGVQKHRTGRVLRGRVYNEMPRVNSAAV